MNHHGNKGTGSFRRNGTHGTYGTGGGRRTTGDGRRWRSISVGPLGRSIQIRSRSTGAKATRSGTWGSTVGDGERGTETLLPTTD